MSAEVGKEVVRLSIIISKDAEESGEVCTPISLKDPQRLASSDDLVVDEEVTAAWAADLVRLAHLKT